MNQITAIANPAPGFLRKPNHKINFKPSTGRVRVSLGGQWIADSTNALVMHEGSYAPVYYFPRSDVRMERLNHTNLSTHCPYKGHASYYSIRAGGHEARNAAWSYETPYDEMTVIKGYVAFYGDKVDIAEG